MRTRVRLAAAAGIALFAVAALLLAFRGGRQFAGDNGVNIDLDHGVVLPAHQRACQPVDFVGRGTGSVRMLVSTARLAGPPLAVTVISGGRVVAGGIGPSGYHDQPIRIPLTDVRRDVSGGTVCVRNAGSVTAAVLGQLVPPPQRAHLSYNYLPHASAMRLEFYARRSSTEISRAPQIAARYGREKASFFGAWTFWAMLALVLAASAAAVALTVREAERAHG